jgi:hypothetical protein
MAAQSNFLSGAAVPLVKVLDDGRPVAFGKLQPTHMSLNQSNICRKYIFKLLVNRSICPKNRGEA